MEFQQLAYALLLAINLINGVHSTVFTIKNNCPYSIAPATLTGSGAAASTTGFELASGDSREINIPASWSGRVWARSECSNNGGKFQCNTGDCGSGQVTCNGAGAKPPTTLAEFTIGDSDGKDTYDVSNVDGFNLPISIVPNGGCETTDCPVNINAQCPSQFAQRNGAGATIGCRSACVQFGTPEYCCTGAYDTPTCPPTDYSRFFKKLCPKAYSYAKDDPSSTFTCKTGANYVITFCP